MSDYISRQAVLDEIENYSCLDKKDIKTIIKALPPVENNGKWIEFGDGRCICSKCNFYLGAFSFFNFCPNCGADMRGDNK